MTRRIKAASHLQKERRLSLDADTSVGDARMMTRRSITWFLAISLGIYVLATSLGVLMRFSYLTPMPWLPFAHAIHAHSHTLYFGWVGLALLALAFRLVDDEGKAVRVLLGTIAVLS